MKNGFLFYFLLMLTFMTTSSCSEQTYKAVDRSMTSYSTHLALSKFPDTITENLVNNHFKVMQESQGFDRFLLKTEKALSKNTAQESLLLIRVGPNSGIYQSIFIFRDSFTQKKRVIVYKFERMEGHITERVVPSFNFAGLKIIESSNGRISVDANLHIIFVRKEKKMFVYYTDNEEIPVIQESIKIIG